MRFLKFPWVWTSKFIQKEFQFVEILLFFNYYLLISNHQASLCFSFISILPMYSYFFHSPGFLFAFPLLSNLPSFHLHVLISSSLPQFLTSYLSSNIPLIHPPLSSSCIWPFLFHTFLYTILFSLAFLPPTFPPSHTLFSNLFLVLSLDFLPHTFPPPNSLYTCSLLLSNLHLSSFTHSFHSPYPLFWFLPPTVPPSHPPFPHLSLTFSSSFSLNITVYVSWFKSVTDSSPEVPWIEHKFFFILLLLLIMILSKYCRLRIKKEK